MHHDWPGNVRELMNAAERGVVLTRSAMVDVGDLPAMPETAQKRATAPAAPDDGLAETTSLAEAEKKVLENAMRAAEGNKTKAARQLGITRKTLRKKLSQYGMLDEPDRR